MKLAAYFNQEAAQLEENAQQHEELAEMYKSRPAVFGRKTGPAVAGDISHCRNIAKSERDEAKEYRELADSHQEMAKAAQK